MPALRHELPTHLAVEDRVLAGLALRQVLLLLSAACGAYALWGTLAPLPFGPRAALVALDLGWGVAFALWRPAGRPLEGWALVLLRFLVTPPVAVWRPAAPTTDAAAADEHWAAFAPAAAWQASNSARRGAP